MNIQSQFEKFIEGSGISFHKKKILLAISGGVDSMVLFHLCVAAGLDVGVAHCNYGLRGDDSESDESLVKKTAESKNLPFFSKKFNTNQFAVDNKLSIQAAARKLRYDFFDEVMKKEGFDHLFTAHHADDNSETILHNFLKGTGLAGLHGILPVNGKIIRPLLNISKHDIRDFAGSNHILFREDASNDTLKYTRNFLRNEVLPQLEGYYPGIKNNLLGNINRFRSIEQFYNNAIKKQVEKLVVRKKNELHLPILKLISIPGYDALLFEILKPYGFNEGLLQNVLNLISSQSGKFVNSALYRVLRNRDWLIISPIEEIHSDHIPITGAGKEVLFNDGIIKITQVEGNDFKEEGDKVAFINADEIQFPLLLRKWRQGDYFYPLGLLKPTGKPAKKKVSRFMNDRKMSIADKEKQWVIENNGKIVWLPGLRSDHRFRVTSATKKMIRLQLISK